MKINIIIYSLVIFVFSSCVSNDYLPKTNEIGNNPYGAYINVTNVELKIIKGELISVSGDELLVLDDKTKQCCTISKNSIKKFSILYAKPVNYGWRIPVYTLYTLSHGFLAIFTAPINLITTTGITIAENKAYTYNQKQLPYNELHMFARFPQGVPSTIDTLKIK